MAIGKISIDIEARLAKFESDIGRAARLLEREMARASAQSEAALKKLETQSRRTATAAVSMSEDFNKLSGIISKAFLAGAVIEFGRKIIDASGAVRGFERGLTAATGSATQAVRELNFVRNISDDLGLSFAVSAKGFTSLAAAAHETALEGQPVRDIFMSVSEASRVLNLSVDDTRGALLAIGQIISKGKVQAEELRGQLGERLPGAFGLAAKAIGVTTSELDNMLKKGQVVATDFLPKFAKELDRVYGAQAKLASSSPSAEFARLGNAITHAFERIGNEAGVLDMLGAGAHVLTKAIQESGQVIVDWAKYFGQWAGQISDYFADAEKSGSLLGEAFGTLGFMITNTFDFAIQAIKEFPINLKALFVVIIGEGEKLTISMGATWDAIRIDAAIAWEAIKNTAQNAWGAIEIGFAVMADGIIGRLQGLLQMSQSIYSKVGLDSLAEKFGQASEALKSYAGNEDAVRAKLAESDALYKTRIDALQAESTAIDESAKIRRNAADEAISAALEDRDVQLQALENSRKKITLDTQVAAGIHKTTDAVKASEEETAKADSAASKYEKSMERLADITDKATGAMGPLSKAEAEHVMHLRDIAQAGGQAIVASALMKNAKSSEAAVYVSVNKALDAETAAYAKNIAEIRKDANIAGPILKELRDRSDRAFMTDRQLDAVDAVDKLKDAYSRLSDEAKSLNPSLEELTKTVSDQALATHDAEKAAQFWKQTWEGAVDGVSKAIGDFAVGNIKTWKDFTHSLVDTFKQAVAQIISEWAKTKIIGWFTGGGGGGGWGSLFAAGAAAFSGSSASASGSSGGATGGFNYNQSGGGGGFGSLSNYASMFNTGGASSFLAGAGGAYGPPTAGQAAFTTYAPYAAGALGAYYGSQQGDGGLGTAGATFAGAMAGYYAGTVAVGALTGGAAAAAAGGSALAGAGAGAAGASGMSAGLAGMTAIPIIGWVALIALVVDKITGGKIFGSKWAPGQSTTDVNFGMEGASGGTTTNYWKYQNQLSQAMGHFGVLSPNDWGKKDYKTSQTPLDPEALAILKKINDGVIKTYTDAAHQFNTEVIPMLDASFQTVITYTKKGHIKTQEFIGQILGKTYNEPIEKFVARMNAEGIIQTLDKVASGASAVAEAFRKDGDSLLDVAQTMAQAQIDIMDDKRLLGAGQSMQEIVDWVVKMQSGDEKLADTYARLSQASAAYYDIMKKADDGIDLLRNGPSAARAMSDALKAIEEQFKENTKGLNNAAYAAGLAGAAEDDLAKLRTLHDEQLKKITTDFFGGLDSQMAALDGHASPATDFALAMRTIFKSLQDNISQANLLAKANGMLGATEAQLSKVHELAARQAAAAIRQLNNLGQQQARSLYGSAGTLADVEADIAAIQGQANSAASSIGGFGDAMSAVADQASQAINLLLGDLSPLNDQQKLQQALTGLYAGLVSKEQVLEIGRRLYASTSRYTDLFNQVSAVPSAVTSNGNAGSEFSTSSSYTGTASLAELMAQRDALQKEQRLNEAHDLADTVASLAAAQDKTFAEIADDLHFNLSDLAKDLGLSYDQLTNYLDAIDVNANVVPDSITDNFDRLLAYLDQIWGDGTNLADDSKKAAKNVKDNEVLTDRTVDATSRVKTAVENGTDAIVTAVQQGFERVSRTSAMSQSRSLRDIPILEN